MVGELFSFFLFSKESGGSARRPAEMAMADLPKDSKPPLTLRPNFNCKKGNVTACGGSPLTLRPNFNCEKGSVTAAAAACMPRRGSFVDENLL